MQEATRLGPELLDLHTSAFVLDSQYATRFVSSRVLSAMPIHGDDVAIGPPTLRRCLGGGKEGKTGKETIVFQWYEQAQDDNIGIKISDCLSTTAHPPSRLTTTPRDNSSGTTRRGFAGAAPPGRTLTRWHSATCAHPPSGLFFGELLTPLPLSPFRPCPPSRPRFPWGGRRSFYCRTGDEICATTIFFKADRR